TAGALSAGISSLDVPGISPTRTLVVPATTAVPDALLFTAAAGYRGPCLTVDGRAACDPTFTEHSESDNVIDRTFQLSGSAAYSVHAGVVAQPGPYLDALLDREQAVKVSASSVDTADPRERAAAAVDHDPRTSWVAGAG